jgi:hypothetical protein
VEPDLKGRRVHREFLVEERVLALKAQLERKVLKEPRGEEAELLVLEIRGHKAQQEFKELPENKVVKAQRESKAQRAPKDCKVR